MSPNPSRAAIKEAILGDEFVEDFMGVIHDFYHTKMTAPDRNASLFHELSKKIASFSTEAKTCGKNFVTD